MELFHAYDWRGNILELQNVVERAVILCEGETFFVDEAWLTPTASRSTATSVPLVANLVEREKEMIENALLQAEGVVGGPTGAAVKLGIPWLPISCFLAKRASRAGRVAFLPTPKTRCASRR
jgi:formate hydrogenlyase transcriptional activator